MSVAKRVASLAVLAVACGWTMSAAAEEASAPRTSEPVLLEGLNGVIVESGDENNRNLEFYLIEYFKTIAVRQMNVHKD